MTEKELKEYIEQKYGNIRAFALEIDIPYTTMRSILERGLMNAKAENVFKICKKLNIKPEDLLCDIQYKPNLQNNFHKLENIVGRLDKPRQEKVLSYAKAQLEEQMDVEVHEAAVQYFVYNYYDQPVSAGTGQYLNDVQIETIQLPVKVDADFVCPIYGDSMEPDYKSGDYVFVKLTVELPSGTVGVFDYEGEAYIKQLIIEKDKAYLRSFNKKYKDIPINSDSDFRIIGKVVDVYREESEK